MVYGTNLATCSQCGKPYTTGDSIELGEKCEKCKYTKVVDLTHLVDEFLFDTKEWDFSAKGKLKQEIRSIMNDALSGLNEVYRYVDDAGASYIRWGLVEQHINEVIDSYWPKEKENE